MSIFPLLRIVTSSLPSSSGSRLKFSPTTSTVMLWNVCISIEKVQVSTLLSKLDSASRENVGPVPARGAPSMIAGVIIQKLMKTSSPSFRSKCTSLSPFWSSVNPYCQFESVSIFTFTKSSKPALFEIFTAKLVLTLC